MFVVNRGSPIITKGLFGSSTDQLLCLEITAAVSNKEQSREKEEAGS